MTAIKDTGLKKQKTYDELINNLNNKPLKLSSPNRIATQLRNSNQLSNLLDGNGEGLINMELQQQNIIKQQQKELVITAMTDSKGTAKVLKVIAKPESPSPQFFDIAQDDNQEKLSNDIEMVSTQQSQQVAQNKTKFTNLLQAHLNDISPSPMDTAHVIASSSGASSSNYTQPVPMLIDKELKRSPEDEHEPKGKVGRPKKTQPSDPSAGSLSPSLPPQPMLIDTDAKRTQIPSNTQINKKSKKQPESEALNDNDPDPEITSKPKKNLGQSAPSSSSNVKKSIDKQTETQIQPSKMNIQLLREKLEHAKINNKLNREDGFAYAKLLAEWFEAKGKPEIKKEKVVGLREIYKRVLYKK